MSDCHVNKISLIQTIWTRKYRCCHSTITVERINLSRRYSAASVGLRNYKTELKIRFRLIAVALFPNVTHFTATLILGIAASL